MNRAVVILLLTGLLMTSFFASGAFSDGTYQTSSENLTSWPMFQHDLTHSGHSKSTGPITNQTRWSYQTESTNVKSSPAIVDGVVYVGAEDGRLYALNANDGIEIWVFKTQSGGIGSPAVFDGVVYMGSYSNPGYVYALDASTGTELWSHATDGPAQWSSPAVAGGMVYIGSEGLSPSNMGYVYALNASSGEEIWTYQTGGSVHSSPAVVNNVVYIGSTNGWIYAFDSTNGAKKWSYNTGRGIYASPSLDNGVIYITSTGGYVYALNATTGIKLWSQYKESQVFGMDLVFNSPSVAEGLVYLTYSVGGSLGGGIYALNAYTGNELWNYKTNPIYSSATIAGSVVLMTSFHGDVYAFNASSRSCLWSYTSPANTFIVSSPAVARGVAYVGTHNGAVTAFGFTAEISPSSVIMDVSQSQVFTTTVFGGIGESSYRWYLDGVPQNDGSDYTWTYTPSEDSLGFHIVYVQATNNGELLRSNIAAVTVNPALSTPVVSPKSWIMDVDQSHQFSMTASGGTGTLHYQWYLDDRMVGLDSTSYYYHASGTLHSIYCLVTDSASNPAQAISNFASVIVSTSPSVYISSVNSLMMDLGQVQVFNAISNGGSGIIHYKWYLDGDTVGSDNATYTYTATGTLHSFTCKITDSASIPVTSPASNEISIIVNPALSTPSISASTGTINQGQSSTLSVRGLSGGTNPYNCHWLLKAPGSNIYSEIIGATSSNYSFLTTMSTNVGIWSFKLQVTDNATTPVTVASNVASVTVNPQLTVPSASASVGIVSQGQSFTLTTSIGTTGTSPYTYQWYYKIGDGPYSIIIGANSSIYDFLTSTSMSTGTWSFIVQITDSTGASLNSTATSVTINTPAAIPTPTDTPTITPTPTSSATPTPTNAQTPKPNSTILTSSPAPTNPSNPTPTSAPSKTTSPTQQSQTSSPLQTTYIAIITTAFLIVIGTLIVVSFKRKWKLVGSNRVKKNWVDPN